MDISDTIRTRKFVIALHESIATGPGHDLRDYLLENKVKELVFITHPLLNEKEYYAKRSSVNIYRNGQFLKSISSLHFVLPMIFLYGKDLLYTMWWIIKSFQTYDLFVGLDPLNAFSAVLLKKIGFVRRTVYYTIDYIPKRYSNPLVNFLYHAVDKFCVANCDETWNLSPVVQEAREAYNGMNRKRYSKQRIVPIGVWVNKTKRVPLSKVNRNKLVYVGGLRHIMGVELLINAMPKLIDKFPRIHLDIIGGGVDEGTLKNLATKLKVYRSITFHGWVRERERVKELMRDGVLGLAPFAMDSYSYDEVKNADPSKIKEYLVTGIPIIVTKAVSSYNQIQEARCGLAIDYSVRELVGAIKFLLKNYEQYAKYRVNALSYVKQFDYNILFGKALGRVLR